VARFSNEEERAAWDLAESLVDKALAMMRLAEQALDVYLTGKEITRQRCLGRGIGATDAEIRWRETTRAKKALADNSFYTTQATMYYSAAGSAYAKALYLRGQDASPHGAAATASSPRGRR
jgi:hypothetical protein